MTSSRASHRKPGLPSIRTRRPGKIGRKLRLGFGGLALALTVALSGCGPAGKPIPQDPATVSAPTAKATVKAPATLKPKAKAKPRVSSCDQAREAFLTGTRADVVRALKRLQADRTADGTAREYADYWQHRDAADRSLQEMDKGLITMACT